MAIKKKSKRTVLRSRSGKKLYAVRDKTGKFKDIQSYARAHAADLRTTSKSEAKKPAAAKKTKKKAVKKAAPKPAVAKKAPAKKVAAKKVAAKKKAAPKKRPAPVKAAPKKKAAPRRKPAPAPAAVPLGGAEVAPVLPAAMVQVPVDRLSKKTSSAVVGTLAPPAPPDVVAHLVPAVPSQDAVPPTQYLQITAFIDSSRISRQKSLRVTPPGPVSTKQGRTFHLDALIRSDRHLHMRQRTPTIPRSREKFRGQQRRHHRGRFRHAVAERHWQTGRRGAVDEFRPDRPATHENHGKPAQPLHRRGIAQQALQLRRHQ